MNKQFKTFLELPDGQILRCSDIVAIRMGDARSINPPLYMSEMKPRVIIDFVVGDHGNCIVIDRESVAERDELMMKLKKGLGL